MEDIEETVDGFLNNPLLIPIGIGIASFASGLGLGVFWAKRKYGVQNEVYQVPEVYLTPEEEIEESVVVIPPPVVIDVDDAVEQGIVTAADLADLRPTPIEPDEDEAAVAMEQSTTIDGWDWTEELDRRTETEPYILHEEEYFANEKKYAQLSLVYYAQDDVLADDTGEPIYNVAYTVGPYNFGHGTRAKDLMFVRNDERKAEYEITRLDESHAVAILGADVERAAANDDIRHSRVLRFRDE